MPSILLCQSILKFQASPKSKFGCGDIGFTVTDRGIKQVIVISCETDDMLLVKVRLSF